MCGIVAIWRRRSERVGDAASPEQRQATETALKRATAAMEHRGPDGQRHWTDPSGLVGLGHARLSIIDLSTGDQPLANEDGSIHAVVNGELYDFEARRAELEARGHRFKTRSDSEILLHLYEEFGLEALEHLTGEFAFVLWDRPKARLIAGRDRFGIKPLLFGRSGHDLIFASEAKALFAAGVPAAWDEASFHHALHLGVPSPSRSLYRGVEQVPPGHVLICEAGLAPRLKPYWDFDYPREDGSGGRTALPAGDERAVIAGFTEQLEASVRRRLRADVPVGVYLSGGLDSCSLLGLAARQSGPGLKAFSLSFTGDARYDESAIASEMAAHAGADLSLIPVTHGDLARHFLAAVVQGETMFFNTHGVAKYMLSAAVRAAGIKVVLTGEGSDEILAGYAHFRRDLLLHTNDHGHGGRVAEALAELARTNAVSRGLLLPDGNLAGAEALGRRLSHVPSWLLAQKENADRWHPYLAPAFTSAHAGKDPYGSFLDDLPIAAQVTGRHPVHQSLYLWSKTVLPGYLLTVLGDRMEMGHSVEGRVPFLDHNLVDYVVRLPVSWKIRGLTEKYLLREAAKPVLTDTVYQREKHPFVAPPSQDVGQSPLDRFLFEYVGDHLGSLRFFHRPTVEALLASLSTLDRDQRQLVDATLMGLASVAALGEAFGLK